MAATDTRSVARTASTPASGAGPYSRLRSHWGLLLGIAALIAIAWLPTEGLPVAGQGRTPRRRRSCYGFHGLHGRALPFAAGVKMARPDLVVIAVGGDGDGYSIGGNHFVHACRRNLDMLYLVMDSRVYGMLGESPGMSAISAAMIQAETA
ncbi:MAG TPA: thiamine pyrophosphate-dependent enzyme [Hyphomicrobiaceae bacterium]|nr:thiamine pyrophosphate-dependent enzyme [Hyphomicrobiaceae bacterium]